MIDPLVSLAFGLHSRKGAYAVLLGSGVSRSAGIPTGWEITLDLVRKVAAAEREECGQQPAEWYRSKHGAEPRYDELLKDLAKTRDERQGLLKGYFEPTEEDREKGLKQPTAAHKAIAELVRGGYIRVIVTTNFDRLIETALEEAGVFPEVVATPDQIKGATPLSQVKCLVVKVHGDYRDTRIRNTPDELEKYDPAMHALLDRVFDEFGLIVCGWSAEYDPALRGAIEKCPSRRYTMFWTGRQPLKDGANRLVENRGGEFIQIKEADSFFDDLAGKVAALDTISSRHPLSPAIAAAEVKRYIVDDRYRIQLADLVRDETERVYREAYDETQFPLRRLNDTDIQSRIERYESITEVLVSVFATGCYWGNHRQLRLWVGSVNRLGDPPQPNPHDIVAYSLRWYPALAVLYAGGVAAIAAERYDTLTALLSRPVFHHVYDIRPVADLSVPNAILNQGIVNQALSTTAALPLSERLQALLRPALRALGSGSLFEDAFDRFEYLKELTLFEAENAERSDFSAPIGLFAFRRRTGRREFLAGMASEVDRLGENWPPFHAGLFGASLEVLKAAQQSYHQRIQFRYP